MLRKRLPLKSDFSKNGAPVRRFLCLKVYLTRTLSVPITDATDVATLIPKIKANAGAALRGAAEGNAGSFRGVSYCSRKTCVDPGVYVCFQAVSFVCPSHLE